MKGPKSGERSSSHARKSGRWPLLPALCCLCATGSVAFAQTAPPSEAPPVAIVPLDAATPGAGATVTGPIEARGGKAFITSSGEVAAGTQTVQVTLPQRGTLRVCAHTSVKLSADTSMKPPQVPGVLIGLDAGALEASFAEVRSSDIVQTPDFRILISGPGSGDVKVRLGAKGDTCVDNGAGDKPDANAPYVIVSSVFDGGVYRVQPGQRVMFQHGNLREVVDNEKEPCGCPPATTGSNEFPLAESMGLTPPRNTTADENASPEAQKQTHDVAPLVYNSTDQAAATPAAAAPATNTAATESAPKTPPGFFARVGGFFRRLFGAE